MSGMQRKEKKIVSFLFYHYFDILSTDRLRLRLRQRLLRCRSQDQGLVGYTLIVLKLCIL